MKYEKNLLWFGIVILLFGDVLYVGSLLFKSFMISLTMILSPELTADQLTPTGESAILFLCGVLGAMMYLVGFLIIALSMKEKEDQIKLIYVALGVWFVFDSFASVILDFGFNVLINLGFLITGIIFLKTIKGEEHYSGDNS